MQAVQRMSNYLPTRLALHRGRQVELSLTKCRRCASTKKTPAHVLNNCSKVHRAIIARHDAVVNRLASLLGKRPDLTVHKEVTRSR